MQTVRRAYGDCRIPSINADLPVEGFRAAFRDAIIAQIHTKEDKCRALASDKVERVVPEWDRRHHRLAQ